MLIILIASFLPVILLMLYIYSKDKCEKEPFSLLMKAFGGGVLVAVIIMLFGYLIPDITFERPFMQALYRAFIQAALPEEGLKFFMLYLIIWNRREFDEHIDGMVYAAFVSLGFAGVENLLYVLQYGMEVSVSRALFAVPGHFFFGIIMGYYFSLAKFSYGKERHYLRKSLGFALLAHGLYDFILFYSEALQSLRPLVSGALSLGFYIFVFCLWRTGLKKIKRQRVQYGFGPEGFTVLEEE